MKAVPYISLPAPKMHFSILASAAMGLATFTVAAAPSQNPPIPHSNEPIRIQTSPIPTTLQLVRRQNFEGGETLRTNSPTPTTSTPYATPSWYAELVAHPQISELISVIIAEFRATATATPKN